MAFIKNRSGQYIRIKNYTKLVRTSFVINLQINTERITANGEELTIGNSIAYFNPGIDNENLTINNKTLNLK